MTFYKYHGTGNDFILFDNRDGKLNFTTEQVAFMCNRHWGIGADGLMTLELADGYNFRMVYYNSDGKESSMCGNGGRCIAHFAKFLGVIKNNQAHFLAIDGDHDATIKGDVIKLKMQDVNSLHDNSTYFVLNTGSPHYVTQVSDIM